MFEVNPTRGSGGSCISALGFTSDVIPVVSQIAKRERERERERDARRKVRMNGRSRRSQGCQMNTPRLKFERF
jgi:hypothetical protein